jgi:hypothetical protein
LKESSDIGLRSAPQKSVEELEIDAVEERE